MVNVDRLQKIRPLGALEKISASCHHLGFFNNVGLSVQYNLTSASSSAVVDLRYLIYAAVERVLRQHPILSAIPINEGTPNSYFASLPSIELNRSVTFLRRSQQFNSTSGGQDKELDALLEDQHNISFKSEYGSLPFWRLVILQDLTTDSEFTACFIYHHAIGDGASGVIFHNSFRNALHAVVSSSPSNCNAKETVVLGKTTTFQPSLEDLHPLPINPTSPMPPTKILKEWTGNTLRTTGKSRWSSFNVSPSISAAFLKDCRENSVSATSAISSIIATVLFSILPPTTEALTGIIPVNLRPWLNMPREVADGTIGSYFDATRLQFTQLNQNAHEPTNIWPRAHDASRMLKDYLANVSPSGEPYTAVAAFKNIQDLSVILGSMLGKPRDAAFEVTNVGLFASPLASKSDETPLWEVGNMLLSRSSLVSGAAITVSVATGDSGSIAVGFSWQDGILDSGVADSVIQGVRNYFTIYE